MEKLYNPFSCSNSVKLIQPILVCSNNGKVVWLTLVSSNIDKTYTTHASVLQQEKTSCDSFYCVSTTEKLSFFCINEIVPQLIQVCCSIEKLIQPMLVCCNNRKVDPLMLACCNYEKIIQLVVFSINGKPVQLILVYCKKKKTSCNSFQPFTILV